MTVQVTNGTGRDLTALLEANQGDVVALAEGLAEIPGIAVTTTQPETNMVFFTLGETGLSNADFLALMLEAGIRMGEVRGQIRAVTHLDVSAEDIELAIREAARIVKSARDGRTTRAAPAAPLY